MCIPKCPRWFTQSDSDWTKRNHVQGCINEWYIDWLIKIRTAHICTSCFVRSATWIWTNRSDEDWHHAPDSCTLEFFRASPKREFVHLYLALFNKNYIFFYILKTKSIRAFSSVLIAPRDHVRYNNGIHFQVKQTSRNEADSSDGYWEDHSIILEEFEVSSHSWNSSNSCLRIGWEAARTGAFSDMFFL